MSRWYPDIDDVRTLHDMQLRLFSGAPGIRDMGQLESALFRPQTGYYKDIIEEAAALWESFMQNHPFVDGNKRTALNVTLLFLDVNGIECSATDDETTDFIYSLFDKGEVTFVNLDGWIRQNTRVG